MSDLSESETMDDIAVYKLHCGSGDGAEMLFKFNDRQNCVSIFPSNGSSTTDTQHHDPRERPLQDHLIDVISQATGHQDYDEYERLVNEALIVILAAGRPLFSDPKSITQDDQSLHPLLFPQVVHFRLDAPSRSASLVPIDASEAYSIQPTVDEGFEEEWKFRADLPRFTPDEIKIIDMFGRGANTISAAVQVRGQEMFGKACGGGFYGSAQGRDLPCMTEILNAFPDPSMIQIPQLIGYIHHEKTRQILGFVRQWIPERTLDDVTIAPEKGQKWMLQISQTIERLHKHGIVWGDGKPINIIIDEKDDAWLIDFGGGTTEGWVDEELAETMEGDKQALGRIIEFLSQAS